MFEEFEDIDAILEDLILKGAVEVSGLDENGEPLFSFTEKIFEVSPKFAYMINEAFHKDIMSLWELGFLSMDITSENPKVSLTDKSLDESEIEQLSGQLKVTLSVIKDAMRSQQ